MQKGLMTLGAIARGVPGQSSTPRAMTILVGPPQPSAQDSGEWWQSQVRIADAVLQYKLGAGRSPRPSARHLAHEDVRHLNDVPFAIEHWRLGHIKSLPLGIAPAACNNVLETT